MLSRRLAVALFALLASSPVRAGEPFHYPAGKSPNGAELKYVNGLPVLTVAGSPDEIGTAVGGLALKPDARILSYPRDLLRADGIELMWPVFLFGGKGMVKHFPADYRTEMDAITRGGRRRPRRDDRRQHLVRPEKHL